MGLAAIFTVLRDQFALIPQTRRAAGASRCSFTLHRWHWDSYIIGFPGAAYWMLGALIAHYGLRVFGLEYGSFRKRSQCFRLSDFRSGS